MSFEALATIADAAPVMLVVLDAGGGCRWCNHAWCELTGCSVEDATGAGWLGMVHPDDRAPLGVASRAAVAFEAEVRVRRADGRYRACLARAAPRRDAGGVFVGHVVSATDVTEWRAEPARRAEPDAEFSAPHADPIRVRFPARAGQLAVVRRLLTAWLEASCVAPDDISAIVLAVSEAASNAIEHAYGASEGWFELEASLAAVESGSHGSRLTVTVRDGGRWRSKPSGAGGRGIGLMARLMDEFETRRSERGTEVWMRRTLLGKEHSQ